MKRYLRPGGRVFTWVKFENIKDESVEKVLTKLGFHGVKVVQILKEYYLVIARTLPKFKIYLSSGMFNARELVQNLDLGV